MQNNFTIAQKILSLLDLTSLNDSDTEAGITALCKKAVTPYGNVAAICVYPKFVSHAAKFLKGTGVRIATVANFPLGTEPLQTVLEDINKSIKDGVNEIDVVFPYKGYLAGEKAAALDFVRQCKTNCGNEVFLKVILETGAFTNKQQIAMASEEVLEAGADFIKTSTGKLPIGATLPMSTMMLLAIKKVLTRVHHPLGFKVSGGIRTVEKATQYIEIATDLLGADWVTPRTFRIGASQLIDEVMKKLTERKRR